MFYIYMYDFVNLRTLKGGGCKLNCDVFYQE